MQSKRLKIVRAAIILFYLACILFFLYVYLKNPLENDVYHFFGHDADKYHCPSCGLTRAVYCLSKFDFKQAFYYHAFFVCTCPILGYIFLTLTVNLFFGKKILPYPKKYAIYLFVYLLLYLAFAIFRNFTDIIY